MNYDIFFIHLKKNLSKYKMSELIDAAMSGNLKEVKRLLESGADINIQSKNGSTALTSALDEGTRYNKGIKVIDEGYLDIIKILIVFDT